MFNRIGVVRGPQVCKKWISNGAEHQGCCYKKWQENYLLVIMRARLSKKGLSNKLKNRTKLEKIKRLGTIYKEYSRLLRNLYQNKYARFINNRTQILTSWMYEKARSAMFCEKFYLQTDILKDQFKSLKC